MAPVAAPASSIGTAEIAGTVPSPWSSSSPAARPGATAANASLPSGHRPATPRLRALDGSTPAGGSPVDAVSPAAVVVVPGSVQRNRNALNEVRDDMLPHEQVVTYMHLGSNDESGHAVFLTRQLKLACRVFHQYPFTSDLTSVVGCLENKKPHLVLVTATFDNSKYGIYPSVAPRN